MANDTLLWPLPGTKTLPEVLGGGNPNKNVTFKTKKQFVQLRVFSCLCAFALKMVANGAAIFSPK